MKRSFLFFAVRNLHIALLFVKCLIDLPVPFIFRIRGTKYFATVYGVSYTINSMRVFLIIEYLIKKKHMSKRSVLTSSTSSISKIS